MILSLWCLIENNEGVNRKVGLGKSQVSCNCLGIKWEVRQSLLQLLGKRKHRITISDSLEKQAEILQSLFSLFLTQTAQIVFQNIPTRSWNQVGFVLMKNEDTCPLECVTCNFFWYLCCFRQGFIRVTLRNKKNIGLIWFMSISSSDFWLLCCTNYTLQLQGKNGQNKPENPQNWNMAKIAPKSDKFTK